MTLRRTFQLNFKEARKTPGFARCGILASLSVDYQVAGKGWGGGERSSRYSWKVNFRDT